MEAIVARVKSGADFREPFIGVGDRSPIRDYPIVTAAATERFTTCYRLDVTDVLVVETVRPAVMEIGPARDSNGDLGPPAIRTLIDVVAAQFRLPFSRVTRSVIIRSWC